MRVICIIQARIGSTRLPAKVLRNICGKTVLEHDIDRLRRVKNIDDIIIATTVEDRDNDIVVEANRLGVKCFRGSEKDVLERYYLAAKENKADVIVRVTSDCPLIDSEITEKIIEKYTSNNGEYDYVSNTIDRTFPRGLDTEVFSFVALEKAYINAKEDFQREHVTPYIWGSDEFKKYQYKDSINNSELRLTLDTTEDLEAITSIYNALYKSKMNFGLNEILGLYKKNPEIFEINKDVEQKKIK